MFMPDDELNIMFHDPEYKFHKSLRDYLKIIFLIGVIVTIGIVLITIYASSQTNSVLKSILEFPLLIVGAILLIALFGSINSLGATDYYIAIDELAHYILVKHQIKTMVGSILRGNHYDLHKIKKFDIQREKNHLIMQIHIEGEDIVEFEVPNEEVAQTIRNEIRRVLDSGEEPDIERRKLYKTKAGFSARATSNQTTE